MVLPEKELNSITAQWESIYGNYLQWNYKTNAGFVEKNGTQPDVPYVFNKSLLNCYPDEDAIPAEEIEKVAVPLIVSYRYDSNLYVCGMGKDNLLTVGEILKNARSFEQIGRKIWFWKADPLARKEKQA